jgi:hypothetical protein
MSLRSEIYSVLHIDDKSNDLWVLSGVAFADLSDEESLEDEGENGLAAEPEKPKSDGQLTGVLVDELDIDCRQKLHAWRGCGWELTPIKSNIILKEILQISYLFSSEVISWP